MRLIDADALDDVVMHMNRTGGHYITRSQHKFIDAVLCEFPTVEERKLIDVFNQELAEIAKDTDPEMSHANADDLMVRTLTEMGFDLKPFEEMTRWYA